MSEQQPAYRYELINAENIRSVADMLLWGAKRFTPKDVEVGGISSRDLKWEAAATRALFNFFELCFDEGLNPVVCFGDLAEARDYPVHVTEGTDVTELSNEVWDDLSFIIEVEVMYWDTAVQMHQDDQERQRVLALERGGYAGYQIKGETHNEL